VLHILCHAVLEVPEIYDHDAVWCRSFVSHWLVSHTTELFSHKCKMSPNSWMDWIATWLAINFSQGQWYPQRRECPIAFLPNIVGLLFKNLAFCWLVQLDGHYSQTFCPSLSVSVCLSSDFRHCKPPGNHCDFRFDLFFSFSFVLVLHVNINNQRISNLLMKTCWWSA